MNREYVYINGNVVVENEAGIKRTVEPSHNLDEILIQENIIETMKDEILELRGKSRNFKKNKKAKKESIFYPALISIISSILAYVLLKQLGILNIEPFSKVFPNTLFGPMTCGEFYVTVLGGLATFLGSTLSLYNYLEYRIDLKKERARQATLEYLDGALEKAKQDLRQMEKTKVIEPKKQEFRIVSINDKKQIRELYGHIRLYYDCGLNGKKYYRYYQKNGELPKKVQHSYTELGQSLVQEYLEEEGPKLVKRKI